MTKVEEERVKQSTRQDASPLSRDDDATNAQCLEECPTTHLSSVLDQISHLLSPPATKTDEVAPPEYQTLINMLAEQLELDFIRLFADPETVLLCVEASAITGDDPVATGSNKDKAELRVFRSNIAVQQARVHVEARARRSDFPSALEQLILEFVVRRVAKRMRAETISNVHTGVSEQSETVLDPAHLNADSTLEHFSHASLGIDQSLLVHEQSLDHTNSQIRQLFDLLPILAWSSYPDGSCEFLNKAHFQYTGIAFDESKQWGWQNAIHPFDLGLRMQKWRESLESGNPSEVEVRIRRYDGVYRWFLLRIQPCRNQSGQIIRWYGAGTDIEEKKRAQANWSVNERKLSLIFNALPMLLWSCTPDGTVDFFNAQWCDYTGTPISKSSGWGWTDSLHPADRQNVIKRWSAVLLSNGNAAKAFELRLRRHDGEYRSFWLTSTAVFDKTGAVKRWYVTLIDIHDRKIAEEGIKRSETLLAEAKRLAGLGVFSFRVGSGSMAWCNALYNMFELSHDTVVTREMIEQRTHPDDRPFVFSKLFETQNGENFEEQVRILMPDGSTKYIQYCAYATTTLSGETEYIGTVQDITQRHLAAEALAQARIELAQASKASSLGILTASIAHEINQPLSGIVMNANTCLRMLSTNPLNISGALDTAKRTIRDANRATDIISRLRTLFSQKEIDMTWWDVVSASRDVVKLMQSDLRKHRIVLKEEYERNLPLVKGDKIQVQQVILNLLRNAIDAILEAMKTPRRVTLSISIRGKFMCFSIADSGGGFAGNEDSLFETFFTTKPNGMGIGLPISRWIVEAHGGEMSAVKNELGGATFEFSLPCEAHQPNTQTTSLKPIP